MALGGRARKAQKLPDSMTPDTGGGRSIFAGVELGWLGSRRAGHGAAAL